MALEPSSTTDDHDFYPTPISYLLRMFMHSMRYPGVDKNAPVRVYQPDGHVFNIDFMTVNTDDKGRKYIGITIDPAKPVARIDPHDPTRVHLLSII